MSEEQWRPVPGWPNYEVSDLGRMRSLLWAPGSARRKKMHPDGILKTSLKRGYHAITLHNKGRMRGVRVHRLMMAAFAPSHGGDFEVDHINGNKLDNRLENLRWATRSENLRSLNWEQRHKANGLPRGVYRTRNTAKFLVKFKFMGKEYASRGHLSVDAAVAARNALSRSLERAQRIEVVP